MRQVLSSIRGSNVVAVQCMNQTIVCFVYRTSAVRGLAVAVHKKTENEIMYNFFNDQGEFLIELRCKSNLFNCFFPTIILFQVRHEIRNINI